MSDQAQIVGAAAPHPAAPQPPSTQGRRPARVWLFLPLLGFLALAVLFFFRLGAGDPSRIPSALLNKPVPDFALTAIGEGQGTGLTDEDLAQGVHVVNVWGSWCGPCRLEHPILMRLAADDRFTMAGINQKDLPENATRFLGAFGNPFDRIGADPDGRGSIEWGVYGVPETFLVRDGIIVHKFVGPLSEESLAAELMPALERALAGS
jgi:cytochrome c biogenesis protein CcmG/thiol:disulfide interchange protein DsbE